MIARKKREVKPPVARGALILHRINLIRGTSPANACFRVTLCVAGADGVSDDFTIEISNEAVWDPVRFNRAAAAHGIVLNRWDAQAGWENMIFKAYMAAENDRRREDLL